jgi:hypothetical protein
MVQQNADGPRQQSFLIQSPAALMAIQTVSILSPFQKRDTLEHDSQSWEAASIMYNVMYGYHDLIFYSW